MRLSLLLLSMCFIAGCTSVESDWQAARQTDTITAYTDFRLRYADARAGSEAALHIDEAAKRICELEWQAARRTDSVGAYEGIVKKYPEAEQARLAQSRIDDLEWEKAQSLGTREAFLAIGERIPASAHKEKALKRIEEIDWQATKETNTIPGYEGFIATHPSSDQGTEARNRLEELSYSKAVGSNSISEYRAFLKAFPQSRHGPAIGTKLKELETDMHEKAVAADDPVLYQQFLKQFPDSFHAKEIRSILDKHILRQQAELIARGDEELAKAEQAHDITLTIAELQKSRFADLTPDERQFIVDHGSDVKRAIEGELAIYKKAVSHYRTATELGAENARALVRLAVANACYARQAQVGVVFDTEKGVTGVYATIPSTCMEMADRAFHISPDDPEVRRYSGWLRYIIFWARDQEATAMGKPISGQEALLIDTIGDLSAAISAKIDLPRSYVQRAHCLYLQKKYPEALADFRAAQAEGMTLCYKDKKAQEYLIQLVGEGNPQK